MKAQMELSTTVLVTMIVAIVLMSFGFIILFKVITFGEDEVEKTLQNTERELQNALATDKKFFILDSSQEGTSGKNNLFGVGLVNRIGPDMFKLFAMCSAYVDVSDTEMACPPTVTVTPTSKDISTLQKNEGTTAIVQITMPENSAPGRYFITIYACATSVGESTTNPPCNAPPYSTKYAVGQAIITV